MRVCSALSRLESESVCVMFADDITSHPSITQSVYVLLSLHCTHLTDDDDDDDTSIIIIIIIADMLAHNALSFD